MDRLGQFALLLGLVLACYACVAAAVGGRTRRGALVDSARRATFPLLATVGTANVAMVVALLRDDFSIRYVAENSSHETPTFFKVLALWAADDGSLLLWNLILAGYLVAVALRFRTYRPVTFPYALAVMGAVQAFYLFLVIGPSRPFATLASPPPDGNGPPALLQNHPLMAVHPPFLYLGFIGFTVPFAFGMAALLSGGGSDHWAGLTRRWTLAVWCFLTVGLTLGALWSYSVLGWGGYWAWDPVENVALLPWLVATAFLHSVMLQERRGIARTWNVVLVISAFALTTFGTFLTRGNVLSSVHTFARTGVGPAYLTFLAVVLLAGFGLVAWRSTALRAPTRIDSILSREAAFVGNNVLLLAATAIVLLGTVFPLAVEAVSNRQVTVGGPYFRQATAPVFLLVLLLAGTAPLLPWRGAAARQDPHPDPGPDRATGRGRLLAVLARPSNRVLRRLRPPAVAAALVVLVLVALGVRDVYAVAGFGLATLVGAANLGEIVLGVRAGRHAGGVLRALRRGRRRYAGLAVHVGLAVLAVGVTASSNFAHQTEVTLKQGQQASFGGYHLRYDSLRTERQPQRTVLTTHVTVTDRHGHTLAPLDPALNLYPSESEPIGSPSIHRGVVHDLYSSVLGLQNNGGSATFRFFDNPGVTWLWVGGALMALAGVAAAWPGRRRRRPPSGPSSPPDAPGSPIPAPAELVETGAQ